MHKKTFILICLLATLETHADGPTYQVFPQLKNLKVNYHVETKKKQIMKVLPSSAMQP